MTATLQYRGAFFDHQAFVQNNEAAAVKHAGQYRGVTFDPATVVAKNQGKQVQVQYRGAKATVEL